MVGLINLNDSYNSNDRKLCGINIKYFFMIKLFKWTTFNHLIKRFSRKVGQKKRNTSINFNANYRTEMKLVPIIRDYYLLQFDALKLFLGVHLHGGSQPNFNFFNVNSTFFNEIVTFTSQIAWKQIFTTFLTLI